MKPRYFNAKYVYLLLAITFHGAYSSSKWSKPYLFFCICRGKKWRWSSCWSRKKKTKHLLRKHWILLGSFFHLSAQRTRGSSRTRTLYMELMEKPKSRSLSLDQCLPHLMCIQSPGGLARIQFLMQWVWAAVWDSIHLTELPGDNSALDLNLSSDYLLFIFPRLFIIPGNTTC